LAVTSPSKVVVPVLTALHAWLEAEKPKLLPKAALRGAMDYLLNHWQALVRYTTDGKLTIDNGAANAHCGVERSAAGTGSFVAANGALRALPSISV